MTTATEQPAGITALSDSLISTLDRQITDFRAADIAIQAMKESVAGLVISDVENKTEVAAVVEAHRMVKAYRVKISKKGKELRAPATAFGKDVLKEEKRLLGLIGPIEKRLDGEREKLRAAERAAAEAEKKAAAEKLQGRVDAMNAVGGPINMVMLANITDEAFELELRAAKEAKAERVAEQHRQNEQAAAVAEALRIQLEAEAEERRIADANRESDLRAAMERAEKERLGRVLLEEGNRLQQAELDRLKQAQAQRVAAERAAERLTYVADHDDNGNPVVLGTAVTAPTEAIDVKAELTASALRFPPADTRDPLTIFEVELVGLMEEHGVTISGRNGFFHFCIIGKDGRLTMEDLE